MVEREWTGRGARRRAFRGRNSMCKGVEAEAAWPRERRKQQGWGRGLRGSQGSDRRRDGPG